MSKLLGRLWSFKSGPSSRRMSKADVEQAQADAKISRELRQDRQREGKIIKLLLLGTGDSGKSTIMKQVKILHNHGFSPDELATSTPVVYQNVFSSMRMLIDAMSAKGLDFHNDSNRDHAQVIKVVTDEIHQVINRSFVPGDHHRRALESLWADASVQKCYRDHRHEFHLQDSAAHFFNNMNRVLDPLYQPTTEDILQVRVCTTGVIESPFEVSMRGLTLSFKLIDVGGQRSERRKWIHCFENVHAILFVVALSEYNQVLLEDGQTNRLAESLKLFETIVNNAFFVKSSVILFLNKTDLLDAKLDQFPLSNYVTNYHGAPGDKAAAKEFIAKCFLDLVHTEERDCGGGGVRKQKRSNNKRKVVFPHFTCATDTDQIKLIFGDVVKIVIDKQLRGEGLM